MTSRLFEQEYVGHFVPSEKPLYEDNEDLFDAVVNEVFDEARRCVRRGFPGSGWAFEIDLGAYAPRPLVLVYFVRLAYRDIFSWESPIRAEFRAEYPELYRRVTQRPAARLRRWL
jgi:hypothetical protein